MWWSETGRADSSAAGWQDSERGRLAGIMGGNEPEAQMNTEFDLDQKYKQKKNTEQEY